MLSGTALSQTPATSRDYSDLWFNANESGWGMNVIHQERILFVTLFVYGSDRRPTWFVGPAVTYTSTDSSGAQTYTGDLYATTGTPFSTVPFDTSSVTVTRVGSITFTGKADGTASVTYSVTSGTAGTGTVTKTVTRQTWANTSVSGTYYGVVDTVNSACTPASDNGASRNFANISLATTGQSLSLQFTTLNANGSVSDTCRLVGNYTQSGRYGSSTGVVQCPVGTNVATYTLSEILIGATGFSARLNVKANCTVAGYIGGVRQFTP